MIHGKQPDRHSRVWRFASRSKTCRGWKQAVGSRVPKTTCMRNRRPETLPEVLTGSYSGLLWKATKQSREWQKQDHAARTHLARPRNIRIVRKTA
jgi:hypothetical protein